MGPTAGPERHRLLHPLLFVSGNGHGDEQDHAEAGAHPQTGGGHGVALAAVGLSELQRGDGLLGVPVDAGHAGAARAAEGVLTTLCTAQAETVTEGRRQANGTGQI